MNPDDLKSLANKITDQVMQQLGHPVRASRDQVCSDCTGTCANRCAYKVEALVHAGADRIGGAPGMRKTRSGIGSLIDHTLLRQDATEELVDQLCDEALESGFASVCVNPVHVAQCNRRLSGSSTRVCTVVGFPLGANLPSSKAHEARVAQELGATELDMVIPVGLLKSGRHDLVQEHVEAVISAREANNLVKVILETCLLTDDEKRIACRLAVQAGANYVKTSTGFSTGGATVADVALMRAEVGASVGVKASGGVKDLKTLDEMVRAGATRIGASAGVKIIREAVA